ncbi:MAG: DUF6146 family protein [Lentimicrobium sp.]|uniref:DUF6146 family protein n=1 Tax=Lentimicrobium sp. TaxID=2034841 RepID=UPI0025FE3CD5|nr:DUF6146 family protein [Lentimicrobium sp.]MCO5255622.1 DUF6146 family protein [Lentimicrobium sp.]MCO5261564.1 DUF6146 family protein [Lentimicrobium sp.]HPJ61448.1 DUF6146 family protein [Lentimicrobium sp.]
MKKSAFLLLLVLTGWACSQQKEITGRQPASGSPAIDTSGYEITIIDPDFERWYRLRFSPSFDRSNDYYRTMNNIGVNNWNDYFMRGRYNRIIGSYINWNPTTDYGIEINRRLYWYFVYYEETFRIRLLR